MDERNNGRRLTLTVVICLFCLVSVKGQHAGQTYANIMSMLHQRVLTPPAQPDVSQWTDLVARVLEIQAVTQNVTELCKEHLNLTLRSALTKEHWALSMLDAEPKIPPGILQGNVQWQGQFHECLNVIAIEYHGSNHTLPSSPFKGQYCTAHAGNPNATANAGIFQAVGSVSVGFCLPSTCTENDLTTLLNEAIALLNVTNLAVLATICQEDSLPIDGRASVSIVVLSILAGVVVLGTLYDVFVIHKLHISDDTDADSGEHDSLITQNNATYADSADIRQQGYGSLAAEGYTPNNKLYSRNIQEAAQIGTVQGKFGLVLQAFSIYTNGSKLLSTETRAGTLSSLNGIRFLSMSWVILGHAYVFCMFTTNNLGAWYLEHIKRFSFMFMFNATVSVDTFFTISGLLVSYLSLREMQKVGGIRKFRWGMFYFHRFWRLTPPYMLVMLLYIPLMKYWNNGPLWPQQGMEKNYCETSWWQNLLYINNFFPAQQQCMAWAWYLANDMQFYIISPLFLIPLYSSGLVGLAVCMMFLLATCIINGVLSSVNNYPMTMFGGGGGVQQAGATAFDDVYIKPYCRIGPYMVGFMFGYLLYRTNCKVRMPKVLNLFGWFVAATCMLSVLYGNYGTIAGTHIPTRGENALFAALSRSVWGLGVCWVLFACVTGYGGIVNTFLSWKVFTPLSRLTYLAYLVHPVVMSVFYLGQEQTLYVSDYNVAYWFLGHLVISNFVAFVLSMVFESPFMGLEKVIFSRERTH